MKLQVFFVFAALLLNVHAVPAKETISASTKNSIATHVRQNGPPVGIGSCESCAIDNFNLVNQYRASLGLTQLTWSATLGNQAAGWSKQMYDTRVFVHSDLPYFENIANANSLYTWETSGAGFFDQWRNSADHDTNMRRTSHVCMGVGIYGDGSTLYATQLFSAVCP